VPHSFDAKKGIINVQAQVLKIGSPSTSVTLNDNSTWGDLITSIEQMPEYQGNFQKFGNGVLISPSGEDGTVSPSDPMHEGDILTLTLKTVGGR
jgi:hypothetical protein